MLHQLVSHLLKHRRHGLRVQLTLSITLRTKVGLLIRSYEGQERSCNLILDLSKFSSAEA